MSIQACSNCKRRGSDIMLQEYDRDRFKHKQSKTYWNIGKLPRHQDTVVLCSCCYRYILEGSNDGNDYWPSMIYSFLSYTSSSDSIEVPFRHRWKMVPDSWRHWWTDEFHDRGIDAIDAVFVDMTKELRALEDAISKLKWVGLADAMDKHFAIPEVRCPWGCSEFLHRANKLHMKDFLWYSSNYQMKCLQAPQGKHWTDFISPSFPSSCLILERFSCSPVVVMSDDGPMILSCRNHCEQSTKAYIHVPESPTGTIYTPNSNGFAPVTVRSRTYKFFKKNVFSDTYCSAKQYGGFGGIDSQYMTSCNLACKADPLSCERDSLTVQGRPDIRAQICDRCTDQESTAYMPEGMIERMLDHAASRYPDPSTLVECGTSSYVSCETAVRLQEQMYGEGSTTLKVYLQSSGEEHDLRLFVPAWPQHFVDIHRTDGYGQRFCRVTEADFGLWALLCISGRVTDVWECLSRSVQDNRHWLGHWLNFATTALGFPRRRQGSRDRRVFQTMDKQTILGCIAGYLGGVQLGDALNSCEKTSSLFSSCRNIHVVDGYFSEIEYSDQELSKWDVIVCVNPEFHDTSVDEFCQEFELRCLLTAVPEMGRGQRQRSMYVRHAGQKFWVQHGTKFPSKCGGVLNESMWEHARIAVFCKRHKADSDSLRRRYLNVIGGQSHVFCGNHKCPLVLDYSGTGDSSSQHTCVCNEGDLVFGASCNGREECSARGVYVCPKSRECSSSICRKHLNESKVICYNRGPNALMYLSSQQCCILEEPINSDNGAFFGGVSDDMIAVPPDALGPTTAHEIPQDIVDSDSVVGRTTDCEQPDDEITVETVYSECESNASDDELMQSVQTTRDAVLDGDRLLFMPDFAERNDDVADDREDEARLNGSDMDFFNTGDLPTTSTGTDQRDIDIEHFDDSGNRIPLCVLMNQVGHLLTRTGHKIRMNKKHKHFCERLVAKDKSKVIPLVYAEGQLFGDIFWQSLDDGTIPGAMPTALWTDKQTLDRLGIASMRDHAKQRLTNPALLTSVDPKYHFMLLDQLSNLGACGKHTRMVLQRGFADHQGKDGVTFREKSDSAEIYGETSENHANVHKLSALVRERKPHFFYTQTCNQKTCRGLRVLREWVESDEAMMLLHNKYSLTLEEASRYLHESAATYISRSWNEVIDMWMRYIIYSPDQPLGPIEYAWYRKEFQDTEGNVAHIHAILRTLYDVDTPSGLKAVLDKIKGCLRELISHEEYEVMRADKVISSAAHLYEILDQAKLFLTHKCHLRCQIPLTLDDGEVFYVCKVKENYFRSSTPQVHTIQRVSMPHIPEAQEIYNRLGMMVKDEMVEECLLSEFHVPICSKEDSKFSPTNGRLFAQYPSSQNLQYTTGHTMCAYLTKYVTLVDDYARAIIKPPGRDKDSCAKAVIEQLHNTKITSNKIRAGATKIKDRTYGRIINHTECISVLLGEQIVTSTVDFVHYSTSPREYRPAYIKRKQPRPTELHDYVANVVNIGQEVRQQKGFPQSRLFSQNQLAVIFDEKSSSLTSDAITQFSIRPPELRFVDNVRLYTRWFKKEPIVMESNSLENIRTDLEERLNPTLSRCQWINGLNVKIVLRRGAVVELLEYARACDSTLFGDASLKNEMIELLLQLQTLRWKFDGGEKPVGLATRSLRHRTRESSRRQYEEYSYRFLTGDSCKSLPTAWTTPVFPKNRGRFLIHILLMFGRFETEYGLMSQATMKDAYVHAGLFDPENAEQSVDNLLSRYVRECLCFQPGSVYLHDRNLILAQAAFFECLLNIDSDAIMGTPCVLQSAMKEQTTERVNIKKRELLSAFIGALYSDLLGSGFHIADLPCRESLESMHLRQTDLRNDGVNSNIAGTVNYDFPPPYKANGLQSIQSYDEQRKVLMMAKQTIDRYINGYSHKNLVVCGGPGNGKTTVCEQVCLYAFSRGLKGISTSIVADRSKALGGMHIHLLCAMQASERSSMSPGQAAEAAVAHIMRKPELLHFWRELQFIYIDELGAVSSEMLATMDIIARHVKDSSRFLGGMLVISSMDVFQLLPVEGTALMLSMNMMAEFNFKELTESVRAATDEDLRKLCSLIRTQDWTDESRTLFRNIITTKCSFLESFEDPNTPEDGIYVFGRKAPCQKIEELFIRRLEQENKVQIVLSPARDEESSVAGNWRPATVPVSQALSRKLKQKSSLYLYANGRYEFTYNEHGKFQQGQLGILLSVDKDDVENKRDIEFFKGPAGCKEFPSVANFNRQYLLECGWVPVMVPYETSKPTRITGRLVARRTQYGVRLRIASTVHASQGATFGKLITAVSNDVRHGDLNFTLWEAAQVVVLLSRTRTCQDLYFVGNPNDVVDRLLAILEMKSKFLAHITSMTRRLCTKEDGATVIDRPPIFRPCDFILDKIPGVYLLVSTRHYGYMYVGETEDLRRRLNDHNSGRGSNFTNNQRLRPWALFGYVYGFTPQDNRRNFENGWKRRAILRRNRESTFSPAGMMNIATDLVAFKNRHRSTLHQLRIQLCGSYEIRQGAQFSIENNT